MNSFNKQCVLSILTFIGLVSANGVNTVNAEQRSIERPMASTFRIRSQTTHGNTLITGHGTAFGINLTEFGYGRHRYVMTACHVVREHDGTLCPNLQLEMKQGDGVRWARLRLVASDPKLDVAVLECETELPVCARFADQNAGEHHNVVMIGSPAGVPLRALKGYVVSNKRIEPSVAYVEYIQEGCSGGPIFDASSQNVIGLCIAGIGVGKNAHMDPHTCLYVSLNNMKHFLRTSLKPGGDGSSARRNSPKGSARDHLDEPNEHRRPPGDVEYLSPRRNTPRDSCDIPKRCTHCNKGGSDCGDRSGMFLP